jgi:GNAT superfamily N-acetyltransferase
MTAPDRPYRNPLRPTRQLTAEDRPKLAGFRCQPAGVAESAFEEYVSTWITTTVWPEHAIGKVRVWLYFDESNPDRLIGFGSLSEELVFDARTGGTIAAATLPCLGLHGDSRGQHCDKPDRFGRRILGGLIEEVIRQGMHAYLVLEVDPENVRAQGLYEEFGFVVLGPWTDPDDGKVWTRMILGLRHFQVDQPAL